MSFQCETLLVARNASWARKKRTLFWVNVAKLRKISSYDHEILWVTVSFGKRCQSSRRAERETYPEISQRSLLPRVWEVGSSRENSLIVWYSYSVSSMLLRWVFSGSAKRKLCPGEAQTVPRGYRETSGILYLRHKKSGRRKRRLWQGKAHSES